MNKLRVPSSSLCLFRSKRRSCRRTSIEDLDSKPDQVWRSLWRTRRSLTRAGSRIPNSAILSSKSYSHDLPWDTVPLPGSGGGVLWQLALCAQCEGADDLVDGGVGNVVGPEVGFLGDVGLEGRDLEVAGFGGGGVGGEVEAAAGAGGVGGGLEDVVDAGGGVVEPVHGLGEAVVEGEEGLVFEAVEVGKLGEWGGGDADGSEDEGKEGGGELHFD